MILHSSGQNDACGCTGHRAEDLEYLFRETFYTAFRTCLAGGAEEPFYLPALDEQHDNLLYYREDFFASALHEIAHWCIAGEQRRRQKDFGYWYFPEGRSEGQQQKFEQVEVKPQALEWVFSNAAGFTFRLSRDNFSDDSQGDELFARSVRQAATDFCQGGVPARARIFIEQLCRYYNTPSPLNKDSYRQCPS